MRKLLLTLLAVMCLLPVAAQSEYISHSRDMDADCFGELNGDYGLLLLSKNKSLVINITNASKPIRIDRPEGANADGLYEYKVIMDTEDTHSPKVEVGRMSDLYKTEFVANLKPDYFIAYRIIEVAEPIRMEDRTQGNDAILDATKASLELTTTIKGLKVVCSPQLEAEVKTTASKVDTKASIITVTFPVAKLQAAKQELDDAKAEYGRLTALIESDKATDADFDKHDEAGIRLEKATNTLKELAAVTIYSDNTNRLSIDISELGPRSKKIYIVMPVEIVKEIYVTEANAFVSEGGRLFEQRKYADARAAYVNAINAKDVELNMKPTISNFIALCDTCKRSEDYAAKALGKIIEMKKNNTATQQQVARFAAAATEFLGIVNTYNPDEFYTTRINHLNKMLEGMPLNITFTTVEWRTFSEGSPIPDVEVWAYYGDGTVQPSAYATPRKFRKTINRNAGAYKQEGLSDAQGKIQVQLDRKNLPAGFVFCPTTDKDIKAVYISLDELMRRASGTYLEKQFRLKMYKRTNKYY